MRHFLITGSGRKKSVMDVVIIIPFYLKKILLNIPIIGIYTMNPNKPFKTITVSQASAPLVKPYDEGYVSFEEPSPLVLMKRDPMEDVFIEDMHDFEEQEDIFQMCLAKPQIQLHHLVPEILCLVFDKLVDMKSKDPKTIQATLSACSRVNRHWRFHSLKYLYQCPVITNERQFTLFAQNALPSYGFLILHLDLSKVRLHQPTHSFYLEKIILFCHELLRFNVWIESLDIFTLQRLVISSPKLKELVVAGHLGPWMDVSDSYKSKFCQSIHRMHVIQMDIGFDGDTGRSRLARMVSEHVGPDLKLLKLANVESPENMSNILKSCPKLQTLHLGWANITEPTLEFIRLPELTTLDLRGCQQAVTFDSLSHLLASCPKLRHLDLSFTNGGEPVIEALIHYGHLETLIMAGYHCSEDHLKRLFEKMGQLRVLSLAWFSGHISDKTLEALMDHCPHLEKLDIRGIKPVNVNTLETMMQGSLKTLKLEEHGLFTPLQPSQTRSITTKLKLKKKDMQLKSFLVRLRARFPSSEVVGL